MAATAITARTLDLLATAAETQDGVKLSDIHSGDCIVVRTKNSTYTLSSLGDGTFAASGGWFAAENAEDRPVRVRGCTWGGSALFERMIAAPGMCIEFDNGVRTTRAREVRLIRGIAPNVH
ncbi:MAG TPA: hypothetical protein VFV78_12560 [Vicinamibacterales bacterium]|nr:hypothetical protein [Vicinamibacterales bacterium]